MRPTATRRPARLWRRLALLLPLLGAACAGPRCDVLAGDNLPVTLSGGLPIVEAEANGRVLPFLLDTGASLTLLRPEGASALRLPVDTRRATPIHGIGGVSRLPNALLMSLRIGGQTLQGLTLPVAVHGASGPGGPLFAGTVGADFLRTAALELDGPAGRAALHASPTCQATAPDWPGSTALPVEVLPSGLVLLPVTLNGRASRALFDTGASRTVLRSSRIGEYGIPRSALEGPAAGLSFGAGAGSLPFHAHEGAVLGVGAETVALSPLILTELPATLPVDLILGQDFIAPRRFWLSYASRRLFIGPSPRS